MTNRVSVKNLNRQSKEMKAHCSSQATRGNASPTHHPKNGRTNWENRSNSTITHDYYSIRSQYCFSSHFWTWSSRSILSYQYWPSSREERTRYSRSVYVESSWLESELPIMNQARSTWSWWGSWKKDARSNVSFWLLRCSIFSCYISEDPGCICREYECVATHDRGINPWRGK